MTGNHGTDEARAGDWLEAQGIRGQPARRGMIAEVLGAEGHEHYRVRWDEKHESILFPADGVILIRAGKEGASGQV